MAEQKTHVRHRIGSEDRLIDRLGDILREMRDWRGATARQARRLSRRHGIGYQAALLSLYRAEMRSACPRRMVICLAAAVELGIDLSGFSTGCRIEEAELSSELRVNVLGGITERRRAEVEPMAGLMAPDMYAYRVMSDGGRLNPQW
ncbi:hypothetical protein ACU4GD_18235 [Cupriavidus basilensis]